MPTGVTGVSAYQHQYQPICVYINHRSTDALEKLLNAIKVGGQATVGATEVEPIISDGETQSPAPELDMRWESDEYTEQGIQYKPRKRKA
eukprot:42971-Eustigmatos_ZCMA.PRE.1